MEYEDELSASYEEKVYDKKEKHRFYVKVKRYPGFLWKCKNETEPL